MAVSYMSPSTTVDDEVLRDLVNLTHALREGQALVTTALDRAGQMHEQRLAGWSYTDIVTSAQRPLVVELVSDYVTSVAGAASRFRHAQARALRAEGMTTQAIADLFGVTRQRISAILNGDDGRGPTASR